MECSHFSFSVRLTPKQIEQVQPQQWNCAVCRTQKSPWICLACGAVLCGRYVNGHARQHAELYPDHCLCMDQGLTIYCYKDDEFVINENHVVEALRMEIEKKLMSSLSPPNPAEEGSYDDELPPPAKMIKTMTENTCSKRTCGLQNLGNTCFMNAILQPLCNLEQFSCFFKELPTPELKASLADTKKHVHSYNTRRNGDTDKVSLVEEMSKVLSALWQENSVSPHSLFSVVWSLVPRFRGYQQQDAHEFMHYLLDKLHSELSCDSEVLPIPVSCTQGTPPTIPIAPPTSAQGTPHTIPASLYNQSSIVSQVFGGQLQSDVTCVTCETESRKLDPILDISLEIPEAKETNSTMSTLTDCLSRFTSKETLEETEWYFCVHCNKRQPSTKQLSLHSLPKVLSIHLKRFRFTSFLRTKVNTPVSFPLHSLDLSPFTSGYRGENVKSALYDLSAVVVHHGSGASHGHYTAYVYSPNAESWYHFNDSNVTEIEASGLSKTRPYILFYTQSNSTSGHCAGTTDTVSNDNPFQSDKPLGPLPDRVVHS